MSTKKTINESFALRVSFVDHTYWDDGSRWTYRMLTFAKRKDRDAEFKKLMETRVYRGQGQEREADFRIDSLTKIETIEVRREYDLDEVKAGKK